MSNEPDTKIEKTPGKVRWEMHSEQHRVWESLARTNVVVAGRRWGKSEIGVMWQQRKAREDAIKGLQRIHWWVAPTYLLTRPIWRKSLRIVPPGWLTGKHGTEGAPDFLEFGSARQEFKSADNPERLVAEGLGSLVVDECGVIPERVWQESLLPALMDFKAPALLLGTPKGRNWFYRMKLRGDDPADLEVSSFGGPSYQNSFIDRTEIERLGQEMPERLYQQEILAKFLENEGSVFRKVRDACNMPVLSQRPTVAIGVDLAKHVDFSVIVGLDAEGDMTMFDRFREISWPLQKARIKAHAGHSMPVLLDSTGIGDPILDDLISSGVVVFGYKISQQSKQRLIECLSVGIEQSKTRSLKDPLIIGEMESFEYDQSPTGLMRYGAPEGLHDDIVIAWALAYWQLTHSMFVNYKLLNQM